MYSIRNLFLFIFGGIFAWQANERPLELATPNAKGVYEFNLTLERRLTMSLMLLNGNFPLLDYSPEMKSWIQFDPNLDSDCAEKWVFSSLDQMNSSARGRKGDLDSLVQLDGRHALVNCINQRSPGPTIVVPLGAQVLIRVRNLLNSEAVSIHVHGLLKTGRWWTDGVPFVQQCPIGPNADYTYRFVADTPGTHWYHGHLMADRGNGIVGGFVVLRPNERVSLNLLDGKEGGKDEQVQLGRQYYVLLQDWPGADVSRMYLDRLHGRKKWIGHSLDGEEGQRECEQKELTFDGTLSREVPVSAVIVNEKGWHNQTDIRRRPSALPLSNFAIEKGENILLRLVNAGISQGVFVWIEEHEFWVVAVDGDYVKPIRVDSVLIFSGERYDILVKGLAQPKRNTYRIIFELMEKFRRGGKEWKLESREATIGLANLVYEGMGQNAGDSVGGDNFVDWSHRKCTTQEKCLVLNCPFAEFPPQSNMTCLHADKIEAAEEERYLGEDGLFQNDGAFPENKYQELFVNLHDGLNGWRFKPPKGIPYFYRGENRQKVAKRCDERECDRWAPYSYWNEGCQCFLNYNFRLGQIVQMVVVTSGGMAHPFHLHGTKFYVLRMGFAEQYTENGTLKALNRHLECTKMPCIEQRWANRSWEGGRVPELAKKPGARDTVVVPAKGFVVIRFIANNPGWFFAHCHLLMHSMDGMSFAFSVGTDAEMPRPPEEFPHSCCIYEEPESAAETIEEDKSTVKKEEKGYAITNGQHKGEDSFWYSRSGTNHPHPPCPLLFIHLLFGLVSILFSEYNVIN